jgi:hypothetical protein
MGYMMPGVVPLYNYKRQCYMEKSSSIKSILTSFRSKSSSRLDTLFAQATTAYLRTRLFANNYIQGAKYPHIKMKDNELENLQLFRHFHVPTILKTAQNRNE